jgi:hypothetical protein
VPLEGALFAGEWAVLVLFPVLNRSIVTFQRRK